MRGGKLLEPLPSPYDARAHAKVQLAGMPATSRSQGAAQPYTPAVSKHLRALGNRGGPARRKADHSPAAKSKERTAMNLFPLTCRPTQEQEASHADR
jgi:hypothetical protein